MVSGHGQRLTVYHCNRFRTGGWIESNLVKPRRKTSRCGVVVGHNALAHGELEPGLILRVTRLRDPVTKHISHSRVGGLTLKLACEIRDALASITLGVYSSLTPELIEAGGLSIPVVNFKKLCTPASLETL